MKVSCVISIGPLRRSQAHVAGSRTERTVDANVALGRFPRSGSWRCRTPDTVHLTIRQIATDSETTEQPETSWIVLPKVLGPKSAPPTNPRPVLGIRGQ